MVDWGERAGMRDELLDREIFYSLEEVRVMVENWRVHYNTVRPHSALGYARRHPSHRAASLAARRRYAPPPT